MARTFTLITAALFAGLLAFGCSKDAETLKREYLEQGKGHFAAERYRQAATAYRNALRQDAKLGEARYGLAQSLERLGDGNATREYLRAADLLPDNRELQLKVGALYLRAGMFEDAKGRALQLVKKDQRDVDAQLLLAYALAGMRDHDAAVSQINELIALDPDQVRPYLALGGMELVAGNRGEAEAAFKRAVATDPKSMNAYLALGRFYAATGRTAEAEANFRQALTIEPANLLANRILATFYLATNRMPDAEALLKNLVKASPLPEAQFGLANFYMFQRRLPEARALLVTLAENEASRSPAELRLAVIDYGEGHRDEAAKRLDTLLARDSRNVDALVQRARWQLLAGENKAALESVTAALAIEPSNLQALYVAGGAHAVTGNLEQAVKSFEEVLRLNPRALSARVQLAKTHLQAGRPAAAVPFAQDVITVQPDDPVARLVLARALAATGDVARAEPHVKWLLARMPNSSEAQTLAGQLRLARGDLSGARAHFENGVGAGALEPFAGLITTYLRAGKTAEAIARVDARLAQTPKDPKVLVIAAQAYAQAGNTARTEALLKQALELGDSRFETYFMLVDLYVKQKRVDEAAAEMDRVLVTQPNSVPVHTLRGVLAELQNRRDISKQHFSKALDIDSRAVVAMNNLAYILAEDGSELARALTLAQSAKEQMPEDAGVTDTLGWVYYKSGLTRQAVSTLEESVQKEPKNATYQYHLGLAYVKAGDKARARVALERTLQLQPNFASAAEVRKVLTEL